MNAIARQLGPILSDFFRRNNDFASRKRVYVENEFGWQLAIPVFSNNSTYGYHIVSFANVEMLGAKPKRSVLVNIVNRLLPKLRLPGFLIEGHTYIFAIDKINGKFLRAYYNSLKSEAFLFFRAKVMKGLGDMMIKLRVAKILATFFRKRAERMKEKVAEKGKELYGPFKEITELLISVADTLDRWVNKFANPKLWDSKERWIATQRAEELKVVEEARKKKMEELRKIKPEIMSRFLGGLLWLTDHDLSIHKLNEICEIEGIDSMRAMTIVKRESNIAALCSV